MNTTTIFSESWINIVFDGRNKAYGAYELRRINDRTLIVAFLLSVSLLSGAAFIQMVSDSHEKPPVEKMVPVVIGDTLQAPPRFPDKPVPEPMTQRSQRKPDQNRFVLVDSNALVDHPDTTEAAPVPDTSAYGEGGETLASAGVVGGDDGADEGNKMPPEESNAAVDWAQEMPSFKGGYEEFRRYILKNFDYTDFMRDIGLEGKIYVEFIVEKDGSITNVKIKRGVHRLLDDEAVRTVKNMPGWNPGIQNGKPVRVRLAVPIQIQLQ